MPGPEPSPSDLQNPVPGAPPPPPSLEDFMKSQPGPTNPPGGQAAAPAAPPDLNTFMGGGNAPSNAPIDKNAPVAGANPIFSSAAPDLSGNPSAPSGGGMAAVGKNIKELAVATLAGLSKDPEKSLDYVKQAFGDDNAKLVDGKVYFKNEGDKSFRPFSAGLKDLIHDPSIGKILNVVASHSRDIAFTAGAVGTGAALGAAGAATTGPAGAVGGAALSGAGGGYVAQTVDNTARDLLGLPNGGSPTSEATKGLIGGGVLGAGVEVATPVVAEAASAAGDLLGAAKDKISSLPIFDTANTKLGKILNLYSDITSAAQRSGINIDTTSGALDSTAIGENVAGKDFPGPKDGPGRLQTLKSDLSQKIGAVLDHADMVAGDKTFKIDNGLSKIQQLMSNAGVKFGPGQLEVPSELSSEDFALGSEPRQISSNQVALKPEAGKSPFGEPNQNVVNDMVNRYNKLLIQNKMGGFAPSEIADTTQAWQKLGDYDQDADVKSKAVKSFYNSASNALAGERDNVLSQLAPKADPAIQGAFKTAYSDYSDKAGVINAMTKDFNAKGSAKDIGESLLDSKNSYQKVNLLKNDVFGSNSQEWADIKGNWLVRMIDNNSKDNFLDAKGMWSDLKSYDPRVLNQLIPPEEQAGLKVTLDKLATIPTKDFTKSPQQLDFTKVALAKIMGGPLAIAGQSASLAHKIIFNLTKDNGPLADFMASDGLLSLAKSSNDATAKAGYIQASDSLKTALSYSEKVPSAKVGYTYEPRPEYVGALATLFSPNSDPDKAQPQAQPQASQPRPNFQPRMNQAPRFQPRLPPQAPNTMGQILGPR